MNTENKEKSGKYELDERDKKILKTLDGEARIPITELAERLDLSHEAVRYRVRKLEDRGVIEKYIAKIDYKKLGYDILAVIMLSYRGSEKKWNELFNYLMEKKEVITVAKVTGEYDLKIAVMSKSTEDFDKVSHKIKTKFSNIIKKWETFIFVEECKWKELPI